MGFIQHDSPQGGMICMDLKLSHLLAFGYNHQIQHPWVTTNLVVFMTWLQQHTPFVATTYNIYDTGGHQCLHL